MENQAINQPTGQLARRQDDDDVIDLVELFYVLWGHVWQIILCLILGAAIAFGVTKFLITPICLQQLGGQPDRPADWRTAHR